MTKFLIAAALATAIASPALAQTATRQVPAQSNLYARDYGRSDFQRHSVNPGFDVYQFGQYLGSDPDPNIRLQLRRDYDVRDPS